MEEEQAQPALTGPAYLRLILLGAAIGIPAALVAAVFLAIVHVAQEFLWHDLPEMLGSTTGPPPFLVIGLPVVGAAIVVVARRFLPGDGGHSPLEGIGGGVTPLAYAPGVALAALGTLAFGAVLGPEAPLIALGSAVGMVVPRFVRLAPLEQAVLATAGSFSAISALFGGPIVGALLMVEGGLERGKALIPLLVPGFAASAIGYTIFVGLNSWPGLAAPGLAVPDLAPYDSTSVRDLVLGVLVGLVTAIAVVVTRRTAKVLNARASSRRSMPVMLLVGGLLVGLIAQVVGWLGSNPMDILFSGQSGVPDLVSQSSVSVVLLLLLGKAAAYAVSLGSGFRGGPVFPAIFIGIAIAMVPALLLDASPTLAVAIGAAAGTVSVTRLLVTAVLFASLLVGPDAVDTVPAAVLSATAAWLVIMAVDRRAAADPVEGAMDAQATEHAQATEPAH